MERNARLTGLEIVTPYEVRHSFARQVLETGTDMEKAVERLETT